MSFLDFTYLTLRLIVFSGLINCGATQTWSLPIATRQYFPVCPASVSSSGIVMPEERTRADLSQSAYHRCFFIDFYVLLKFNTCSTFPIRVFFHSYKHNIKSLLNERQHEREVMLTRNAFPSRHAQKGHVVNKLSAHCRKNRFRGRKIEKYSLIGKKLDTEAFCFSKHLTCYLFGSSA